MNRLGKILSARFDYATSSRTSLLARFWGFSGFYVVSTLATRFGFFGLLLVYWRYLRPGDFGIVAVAEIVSMGLQVVLTGCLEAVVIRFYHEWKAEERPGRLGALWAAGLVGSAMLAAVAYVLGRLFWDRVMVSVPYRPYLELAVATGFAQSLTNIPVALTRIRERFILIGAAQVLTLVGQAAAGVLFVVVLGWGAAGALTAALVTQTLSGLVWSVYMTRQVRWSWSVDHLRIALAFSLPLVPATVFGLVCASCDRYFLSRTADLAAIGLYAVALRFASVVTEANQALREAWTPFVIRLVQQRPDGVQVAGRMAKYYVSATAFIVVAVILLSGEALRGLAPEAYESANRYVPLLTVAAGVDVLNKMAGVGFSLASRSRLFAALSLFETILTVALVGVLTDRWGPIGTAWAVLLSRGIGAAVRFFSAVRVLPIPYEYGRMLGVLASAAAACAGSALVPPSPLLRAVLWKVALLGAAAAMFLPFLELKGLWSRIRPEPLSLDR